MTFSKSNMALRPKYNTKLYLCFDYGKLNKIILIIYEYIHDCMKVSTWIY